MARGAPGEGGEKTHEVTRGHPSRALTSGRGGVSKAK